MTARVHGWAALLEGRTLLGRYTLGRLIGTGGMGAVFAASQIAIRRPVAVKILLPQLGENPTQVERFRREAILAASVARRGVADVIDFDTDPVVGPFLVMELLTGESLEERLARSTRLGAREAVEIVAEALATLAVVHEKGIVHRDLKPANVFLATAAEGERVVKLLDFGIARVLAPAQGDLTRGVVGTPRYMSPEQASGADVTNRADLYALGAVLYACLGGKAPYAELSGEDVRSAVVNGPPAPLRALCRELPPAVEALVARAMAREPRDRFRDATAMRDALVAALPALPIGSSGEDAPVSEHETGETGTAERLAANPSTEVLPIEEHRNETPKPASTPVDVHVTPRANQLVSAPPRARAGRGLWFALAVAGVSLGAVAVALRLTPASTTPQAPTGTVSTIESERPRAIADAGAPPAPPSASSQVALIESAPTAQPTRSAHEPPTRLPPLPTALATTSAIVASTATASVAPTSTASVAPSTSAAPTTPARAADYAELLGYWEALEGSGWGTILIRGNWGGFRDTMEKTPSWGLLQLAKTGDHAYAGTWVWEGGQRAVTGIHGTLRFSLSADRETLTGTYDVGGAGQAPIGPSAKTTRSLLWTRIRGVNDQATIISATAPADFAPLVGRWCNDDSMFRVMRIMGSWGGYGPGFRSVPGTMVFTKRPDRSYSASWIEQSSGNMDFDLRAVMTLKLSPDGSLDVTSTDGKAVPGNSRPTFERCD